MLSMTYFRYGQRSWTESAVFGLSLSYYGVAEGTWSNSTYHLLELVGVDAESVKCSGLGEFAVSSV